MSENKLRKDSWSRYWKGGALHSCGGSFDGNYADSIGAFWRTVFAPLTSASHVLDVATGNGALPKLLLDAKPDAAQMPQVHAIDLAAIDPPWRQGYAADRIGRVQFHAGVAAENLPFANGSFDLVISQYGLEYADLERATDELVRVLKPGAQVALVLHHAESLPVRLGASECKQIDWLLQSGGVVTRARRLLPFLARLATPEGMASVQRDPEATKARQRYNDSMREIESRAQRPGADVLIETQEALARIAARTSAIGRQAAEAELNALVEALEQSRLRQSELVAHALDAAAVKGLGERLARRDGLTVQIDELRVRGEVFGWSLQTSV